MEIDAVLGEWLYHSQAMPKIIWVWIDANLSDDDPREEAKADQQAKVKNLLIKG